jgi:hypothetical protein
MSYEQEHRTVQSAALPPLPRESAALEARLAELRPREDRLDRDRLMFLAGQASVDGGKAQTSAGRRWAWPASFAGMSAVAAALLAMLLSDVRNDQLHRPLADSNLTVGANELDFEYPMWRPDAEPAHGHLFGSLYRAGMPLDELDSLYAETELPQSLPPTQDIIPLDASPKLSARSLDQVL